MLKIPKSKNISKILEEYTIEFPTSDYDYFQKEKNAWKIEIINDYVNIRSKPSIYEGLIKKARKGDVFKVLEIILELLSK